MREFIEKIRSNTWLSVISAVLLGVLVLFLSKYLSNILRLELEKIIELSFYSSNVIFKFLILGFSILLILIVNKWSLKEFGFRKPSKIKLVRFLLISIGIIIASFIVGNIIFNGILRTIFSEGTEINGFPKLKSILEMILTVWIWSSICEEVLTRGLIQGFLDNQTKIKFLKLSLPVWVSGLFFGAMHLSLLKTEMDLFYVGFIVFNTTALGLLAAFYREKTGSVYIAIFLHILANVLGSLPAIIMGVI